MLVADALNVVLTIAVVEHRWAFKRFDSHNLGAVQFLKPVTCRDRTGRPGRRDKSRQPILFVAALKMFEYRIECRTGAIIMNEVVRELGELVDDDVLPVARQFSALVVDLLDVTF